MTGPIVTVLQWVWRRARPLVIIVIALSMAEIVALDLGLILAADILLYVELLLAGWAFAVVARISPNLANTLALVPFDVLRMMYGEAGALRWRVIHAGRRNWANHSS